MHEIKENNNLEGSNKELNLVSSNDTIKLQKQRWEQAKILISKNIEKIFWKAWIKPLNFDKYEEGILHFIDRI